MRSPRELTLLIPLVALIFLAAVTPGCNVASTQPAHSQDPSTGKIRLAAPRISVNDLERMNRAFADRTVMRLSTASELLLTDNPDLAQCRRIRDIRATASMSIYDIVTDRDPYLQTLNLTVVMTLQKIAWIDEDNAHKVFGDRAGPLIVAINAAYADVRELAALLFSPAQLQTLDGLIVEWRQKNPDVRHLFNAQFTDFINSSELTAQSREKAGGLFNEIEQTRQAVEDSTALADRALYIGKRMPLLLAWRSQATADSITANPQVAQALADLHTLAGTADHLPATLDAQRKSLLAEFDQRQQAVDSSVRNVRDTLDKAESLAASAKALLPEIQKTLTTLQETLKQGDTLAGRYLPSTLPATTTTTAPASPLANFARTFDVQDYTAALREASQAARDLNAALLSSEKLLDSPAWQARINEINIAADGRVHLAADQSHQLVDLVFRNVYVALAIFFLILVFARLVSAWLLKKSNLPKP